MKGRRNITWTIISSRSFRSLSGLRAYMGKSLPGLTTDIRNKLQ